MKFWHGLSLLVEYPVINLYMRAVPCVLINIDSTLKYESGICCNPAANLLFWSTLDLYALVLTAAYSSNSQREVDRTIKEKVILPPKI